MKTFFDAWLKHLANVAGYPTAAIPNCSQFKRTRSLIFEVWEALYRTMLDKSFSSSCGEEFYSVLEQVVGELLLLPHRDIPTNFNSLISTKKPIALRSAMKHFEVFHRQWLERTKDCGCNLYSKMQWHVRSGM